MGKTDLQDQSQRTPTLLHETAGRKSVNEGGHGPPNFSSSCIVLSHRKERFVGNFQFRLVADENIAVMIKLGRDWNEMDYYMFETLLVFPTYNLLHDERYV